jgi:hypothetical protein
MFHSKSSRIRFTAFRMLVLSVWLLGVPGLRPAFHDHQSINLSDIEQAQLFEHLEHYQHLDNLGIDELHLHWLVLFDGYPIPYFPTGSLPLEHSLSPPTISIDFDPSLCLMINCHPSGSDWWIPHIQSPSGRLLSSSQSHRVASDAVPIHRRFDLYSIARYASTYL